MPKCNDEPLTTLYFLRWRARIEHERRASPSRLERVRQRNPLKLSGVIKESGYEHPHGHVRLETADKTWLVVLAPPSRMSSRGLPAAQLKAGVQVEVVGYANRSKADELRAERIVIGGKTIELR